MENNLVIVTNKLQKAMLLSGGKVKSNSILKNLLKEISKSSRSPEEILNSSLLNVSPLFSLKTQKKGKRVVQSSIPIIGEEKRLSISARWVVKNAKKHSKNNFKKGLISEINDSSLNQGFSKKQQQELNKLVVLNRSAL
jgi:ribosomal protein S7